MFGVLMIVVLLFGLMITANNQNMVGKLIILFQKPKVVVMTFQICNLYNGRITAPRVMDMRFLK